MKQRTVLSRARVADLLGKATGKPIVVLGDVMLDYYVHGEEVSPELPFKRLNVVGKEHRLGGAANAALNIARLGGQASLIGVTGDDETAKILRQKLAAEKGKMVIEPFLVIDPSRPTTVKTRFLSNGTLHLWTDEESKDFVAGTIEDRLKRQLQLALGGTEIGGLIISDYQKGVVTEGASGIFAAALEYARGLQVPVHVDPKYRPAEFYRGVNVITPNLKEASSLVGRTLNTTKEMLEAGPELLRVTRSKAVLVTQGKEGMTLFEPSREPVHIPALPVKEADTVGAGDTVISALALMRAAGATFAEAAVIANAAAGIVVGKTGTATVTPQELPAQFHR